MSLMSVLGMQKKMDLCELEVSLDYVANFRPAKAT